ncbi:MAG: Ig-like domain-containing protein [Bacteroidota bacterium]
MNALPIISGTLSACVGSGSQLTGSGTPAGSNPWTSANTAIATVSTTGVVTGVAAGSVNITYTNISGCSAVVNVTVSGKPPVTGTTSLCVGSSTTLTGTPGAGSVQTPTWTASNANATINGSGFLTAVTAGLVTIRYTNTFGCYKDTAITINASPSLTGASTVCVGSTITLVGSASPATPSTATTPWQSSNAAIASVANVVNINGVVTGVAAGNCSITYTNTNGCAKTNLITVNPKPSAFNVTGTGSYCIGLPGIAVGLSGSQAGINYELIKGGVATGNIVAGTNAAISFGIQTIGTYTVSATASTGCLNTMTGNAVIANYPLTIITGTMTLCVGSTTTLTGSPAGSTNPWISNHSEFATITSGGLVTAIAAGTDTIRYNDINGCQTDTQFIITPPTVGGTVSSSANVCTGTNNGTLRLTGYSGSVVRWEYSPDGITWTTVANITDSLVYTNLTATRKYRAVVKSGLCSEANSSIVTITVSPVPTIFTVTGGGTRCEGSSTGLPVGLSGSQTSTTYLLVFDGFSSGITRVGTGGAITFGNYISAGTYTVLAINAFSCISTMTGSVTIIENPRPTANITQTGPINICSPATQVLNISTTAASPVYQWYADGILIVGATASSYTAGGLGTTIYSVIASSSATTCVSLKSRGVVVTVNSKPSNVLINPDSIGICSGGNAILSVSNDPITGDAVAMLEDFNDTASLKWTVSDGATSPLQSGWGLYEVPYYKSTGSPTFSNFSTQNGGWFALADADAGGGGSTTLTILYSDTFSLANYNSATLSFEHSLQRYSADSSIRIEMSKDGGVTWDTATPVKNYMLGGSIGSNFSTANESINIDPSYLGLSNLMMRFYYKSSYGYYWLIDNVKVSGIKSYASSYTWSPALGLNTTSGSTVVASPLVNTSYIATATSSLGCFAKDTADVTLKPRPSVTTEPNDTAVCIGAPVFSISADANGIGTLNYQWYSNTSNVYAGATLLLGENGSSYSPSAVTAGIKYYFAIIAADCGSDSSRIAKITVNDNTTVTTEPLTPAPVCVNGTAPVLTVVATGSSLTYQWFSNTANTHVGSTLIPGASLASYTPPVTVVDTLFYYVVVTGTCATDTSNAAEVMVRGNTSITTQPVAPAAVCINGTAPVLSVTATGTTLTYLWYSNVANNNTSGTSIPTATSSTYTPPVTVAGTLYYYVVVTGACGPVTSNAVAVLVNSGTLITTQPATPAAVCINGIAPVLSVTASGTALTYLWYSNIANNNTSGTSIPTATSSTYTPPVTAAGTLYYYVVVTGTCGIVTSSVSSVVVNSNTSITTQPVAPAASCINGTAPILSVTATGTTLTYLWYSNVANNNTTGTSIPTATSSTYTPPVTAAGTLYYYVVVTGACGPVTSNAVAVLVNPNNTVTLTSAAGTINQNTCSGTAITPITYNTTGATGATFASLPAGVSGAWAANVVTISGTPTVSGVFNYIVTLTGGCGAITTGGTFTINTGNIGPLAAGTYYIPVRSCSDFPTIAAAVSYLNTNGIANTSGNWIFKVDSNYTETLTTTLALGNSTLNSGINGVSATKHIVFQKNGVGNNPKVIAYPGTQASFNVAIPDGIWSLRGVDYVTIDGIDLQDNNASGNAMMEYGYGLFKTGVADGAQNDTIRNCVISLNRNNITAGAVSNFDGSVGIAVLNTLATTANTAVAPNAVSGANSNNKFFKNTIQNCNIGIGISGFGAATIATFADGGNSIGDSLSATSGNQMINFGGGTSAAVTSYGIYIKNQIDAVVAYNTVNNHVDINGADHPAAQTGIEATGFAATTGIGIKGNNITINGGGDKNYIGINNTTGGGGTVNITGNFVSVKIPNTITTTAAGSVTGIKNANNQPVATLSISGNSFKRSTISGVGNWTAIYNTGASTSVGTINMNSNIIDSNEIKSTGALIALQNDGSPYLTLSMNGNSVTRNSKSVSSVSPSDYNWIKNSATSAKIKIQNNLIEKDTAIVLITNGANLTITGVRIPGASTAGDSIIISNNTIRSLSILGINSTFAASIRGYYNALTAAAITESINNNKISNLYILPATGSSGTHSINGIQSVGAITPTICQKNIYLNAIDTFYVRNNGDASPQYNSTIAGIYNSNSTATNGSNLYIYRNKISHLIPFGTGATTFAKGIWLGSLQTSGNAYIYNNMVNLDLSEAFDGASTGSSLTALDAIRGIDISQTSTSNALLYFNTVRIAGAGNATSGFGSSALSLSSISGTPNVTLRNNILVNKSTAGITGYAVALRKSLAGIVYNNASSNNLFYVDTTGRRYMYLDLATGFNSLTGTWNASSRELASVTTAEPSFIKATDGTDSLHLNIVTNCAMSGTGITITTPSITKDIDDDTRNNPPAMGADEFTSTGQGIGNWSGVNSNWNDPINWCGLVPNSLTDVVIPISRTNYPIINVTTTPIPLCRNITVNNGGTVNVLTGGKISIYGNTSTLAGGIFNTKLGTVEFDGSVAQTIGASTFQNNNVRNIIINNSSATGVTLGGPLNLLGKLSFAGSNRIFATAGNLTMKSSDTLTANLGDITKDAINGTVVSGNQVTGDIMVERFVSGWRAWRLLSMPTTHNLQTIKEAWQENQAANSTTPAGYGIQITKDSANWNTTGFDLQTTPGPSVKYFVTAPSDGGNWKGITSTIDVPGVSNGKFEAGKAYMTFYRGDRTVNTYIASQVTTTSILREKGQLFTGNYPTVSVPAHQFIAIGNPYASAIDFTKFDNVNIDGFIWLWDPKINNLGAYQVINPTTGDIVPGAGSYSSGPTVQTTHPVIESGQGFFVHNGSSTAGSITLKESSKADGSNLVTRNSSVSQHLRTNFYKLVNNSYKIYDGVLNVFDENNSNEVDGNDAMKFTYLGENLSLGRSDKLLAIETRSALQETDTLFYKLGQVKVSTYQLEFIPENLDQTSLRAYLEDRYLNTSTPVSLTDTTRVDFSISSVSGSYDSDRFRMVFKKLAPVPVTFVDIKAEKQKDAVKVSWKVENEINIRNYTVERSANGRNFTEMGTVPATGSSLYSLLDNSPLNGDNFYRVKSIGASGEIKYSKIVKISFQLVSSITIYPNPILSDKVAHVSFRNLPQGEYFVNVMNELGQIVLRKTISHTGGIAEYAIVLDKNLAHGNYQMEISNQESLKTILKFLY